MNKEINGIQIYAYIEKTGEIVEYDGASKTMNFYPSSWMFLGEGYICGYDAEGKLWSFEDKQYFFKRQ